MSTQHNILAWERGDAVDTSFLIVGKKLYLRNVDLIEGMEILGLGVRSTYRLDKMDYENERDEKNGVRRLYLTPILHNGKEGKQKVASDLNQFLAVKTADVHPDHQELFYPDQDVTGTIENGAFHPDEKYLVNWHAMFMKFFDVLRAHPFNGQTNIQRNMPRLVRRCIEEIGVGYFNEFVRQHYVGKQDVDGALWQGEDSMYNYGWFSEIEKSLNFPQRVLLDTMSMTQDFNDAVRTVVFKEGIKLDIAKLIS